LERGSVSEPRLAITALGVDYVEANSPKNQVLHELLTAYGPKIRLLHYAAHQR
jgi:hypothetical protein